MPVEFAPQLEPLMLIETANQLFAGSAITRLFALDELWSQYLSTQGAADAPDIEGLLDLAGRLGQGIVDAGGAAQQVQRTLERQSEASVREGLNSVRQVLTQQGVSDWPFDDESTDDNVREILMSACTYIRVENDTERSHLAGKIELLRAGSLPDPDLRPVFRCVLSLVGIAAGSTLAAAGAVATLGALPAVAIGVLAVAGSGALAWEQTGCTGRRVKSAVAAK